ncbi:c-type cytochrome domain-containing protein [Acanthopleuribacter pedis]|uniref:Cytochrome C Planctomycete-type domain-containing protein n=1 Tax=Acanthopleuribacter pedis TaxID=442870 RepID=A0A8J7QC54_9BACT|nr:c-type cytochrome domain-containing protein [Acanthopleuribacter pedis]MBO1322951.1 hypothetical protein [Acanthopleuribacter pedis]
MIALFTLVFFQAGIDAGPAGFSCGQSITTLSAAPIDPPANHRVQWVGAPEPGIFYTVNPTESTEYRVQLIDLDSDAVYEDTTWVLVHPGNPDISSDGDLNGDDWAVFYANWQNETAAADLDPNNDGRVDILDWFYFCNFDARPENTPPNLSIGQTSAETIRNVSASISFQMTDAEQIPTLTTVDPPANGSIIPINNQIRYFPNQDFVGIDRFAVAADDGYLTTEPISVEVSVIIPETWADLKADIFDVHCESCHMAATEGGFSLNTYELAQAGGNSGRPGFVSGEPEQSSIYTRVAADQMPPPDAAAPLSEAQKERIRLWIIRGVLE